MAQGTISKHVATDKSVTWRVRTEERDPITAKRRQPMRTFKTRREAAAFLAQRHADIERGVAVDPSKLTTAEYLVHWLEVSVKPRVRPSTHSGYERLIRVQLVPRLGAVPLQKLSALHIQQAYTEMLVSPNAQRPNKTLSNRTIRYAHTVLKMALKQALRWRLVPLNVAGDVDPPKAIRPHIRAWNAQEAQTFLEGTANDSSANLWVLALATGARLSELRGLRWTDVDLDKAVIHIRQQITRVGGTDLVSEPKTRAGRRSITLPAKATEALRLQLAARPPKPLPLNSSLRDTDTMFTNPYGGPAHQDTIVSRFNTAVERLKLPRITFHGRRHTHATLLLLAGVNVKAVSSRLGHASIQITLDTYAHVLPEMEEHAADAIGHALTRGA